MKRLLLIALSVISAFTLCIALTACKEDTPDIANEKVYTITYDYDGDVLRDGVKLTSKTETVKESEISSFTLPTAVKKGYNFMGWLNGGEVFTTASFNAELTLKLTPEFTSRSYVFNYKYDGGLKRSDEEAAKTETVAYEDLGDFTLPAAIKRGYTFEGWLNGDEEFDLSALDEEATYNLTPEFTVNTYTIVYRFDGDLMRGGVKLTGKTEMVTFDKLNEYETPVAVKKGYTFVGWLNGTMPFDKSGVDASATFTLTAKFNANEYSFTYNVGDDETVKHGNTVLDVKQETITADDLANGWTLPDVLKTGYDFDGWHFGGMLFDPTTLDEPTTVTLSPAFTAKTYKVKYYLTEEDSNPIFEDTATYDQNYVAKNQQYLIDGEYLTDEMLNGKVIVGWKINGQQSEYVGGVYTVDGDISLVAITEEKEDELYVIYYVNDSELGYREWKREKMTAGQSFTLPSFEEAGVTEVTEGYHLAWLDKNGAPVLSGTFDFGQSLHVYLKEVANKATVNFEVIGGDTARFINLITVSTVITTGVEQPQVIFEANADFTGGELSYEMTEDGKIRFRLKKADNKVYVFELKWSLEKIDNSKPTKFYEEGATAVVKEDNSTITVYAFFDEVNETPNA